MASRLPYESNSSGPMSLGAAIPYSKGGYDYKFEENVKNYKCLLCSKVMREAMQSYCRHHYCRSCILGYLNPEANCVSCNKPLNSTQVFSDLHMRNIISTLEVQCPYTRCVWCGSISTIEQHTESCKFKSEKCEYCQELVEVLVLSQHKENCSKTRNARCTLCNQLTTSGIEHLCGKEFIKCIFGCSAVFCRDQKDMHEDPSKLHCTNMPRSCPYINCPGRGSLIEIDKHLAENPIQHALYYKEHVESISELLSAISKRQDKLEHENTALKKELSAVQQSHYATKMKLSCYIRKKTPPLPDESWDDFLAEVTIPTNGVLIWEIPNFKSIFNNANRLTKIYSQPFYTTPAGFKLCCYAQKEDDQVIRVTIQRMEGKFDGILGNLELESVRISILNLNRKNNIVSRMDQMTPTPLIGPIELTSLLNIVSFIGESNTAVLEVITVPKAPSHA